MGDGEKWDYSYVLVASWMTADKIGPGKIQPLVRIQQAKEATDTNPETSTIFEGQIGYVIDNYATRFALGFSTQRYEPREDDNRIYLGLQLQK
jgi:hypothetical protein